MPFTGIDGIAYGCKGMLTAFETLMTCASINAGNQNVFNFKGS